MPLALTVAEINDILRKFTRAQRAEMITRADFYLGELMKHYAHDSKLSEAERLLLTSVAIGVMLGQCQHWSTYLAKGCESPELLQVTCNAANEMAELAELEVPMATAKTGGVLKGSGAATDHLRELALFDLFNPGKKIES